ncbi:hypothetical protein BES08_17750 (plasmid) [Novosphingobium resinovorum]|uniref:Uncharacterized protein n=1 Tax=Novosphingobium resinovorum TaxID=158500 RepID=A0A1D8A9M7_9SPHN|nr:hypothetical protein BES08_17750 [Novosphingobium resinovorum]
MFESGGAAGGAVRPYVYNHFNAAWAWAMNSPYPWWKQIASQAGGTRNGMVVSWPARIRDGGTFRSQYAHVSDVAPTILEAAGVKAPETVQGVKQQPIDGISLAYSFAAPKAPSARRTQVYEMMENFGIYHDGWMAGTLPKRMAWEVGVGEDRKLGVGPENRKWTLFNLDKDFTTANDLAAKNPAKLKELQDLFWKEAAANNILPIHDYSQGAEGRPTLGGNRTEFTYLAPLSHLNEDAAPHTIGKSFTIDADVDLPAGAQGVLVTQGGRFGGYAFYLKDGVPVFHYNAVGTDQFTIRAAQPVAAGHHSLTAAFQADKQELGSGGTLTISIDGKPVGSGRIGRTIRGLDVSYRGVRRRHGHHHPGKLRLHDREQPVLGDASQTRVQAEVTFICGAIPHSKRRSALWARSIRGRTSRSRWKLAGWALQAVARPTPKLRLSAGAATRSPVFTLRATRWRRCWATSTAERAAH